VRLVGITDASSASEVRGTRRELAKADIVIGAGGALLKDRDRDGAWWLERLLLHAANLVSSPPAKSLDLHVRRVALVPDELLEDVQRSIRGFGVAVTHCDLVIAPDGALLKDLHGDGRQWLERLLHAREGT
jgi:hypothetical protein